MTATETSPGCLPVAPLSHAEPTAVGEVDLGSPLRTSLSADSPTTCRDQVLLVRLHGDPVGIVHLDLTPGSETPSDLARAIWTQAGDLVAAHATRFGCAAPPSGPDALVHGLASNGGCPGRTPTRPEGRVAVIVATVGRVDVLERALAALLALICTNFEIIVVDNRPTTLGTRRLVERFAKLGPLRYVAEPRPGLAIARNTGVLAAEEAVYVVFTDDDVVVDAAWLSWLLTPFRDDQVHAVTGMVLPLALTTRAQKRFELYSGFGKGVQQETYDLSANRADHRLLYPFWGGIFGSGNSMAFRRRDLIRVGGFDPALGAGTPTGGGEDIAAFTDIILHGGRVVYEPRSLCWHEHRRDAAALNRQVYSYGVGFTAALWRFVWSDWRFLPAAARSIPVLARVLARRRDAMTASRLPSDLARLEFRGRIAGPWRYEQSRRIAKRSRADRPFSAEQLRDAAERGAP